MVKLSYIFCQFEAVSLLIKSSSKQYDNVLKLKSVQKSENRPVPKSQPSINKSFTPNWVFHTLITAQALQVWQMNECVNLRQSQMMEWTSAASKGGYLSTVLTLTLYSLETET